MEGVSSGELNVLVRSAVNLDLVVGVDVEGRVPVVVLGSATLATSKLVLPEELQSRAVGGTHGRGHGGQAGENGEEVEHRVSRSETCNRNGGRKLS